MRIGIIGGGLTGLTAAYDLARSGHEVEVFEMADHLGGQVATFPVGGEALEVFYHHIFDGDADIIQLIDELGLSPHLEWRDSKVGFFHGGKAYPFVTPWDLLRFSPLPLLDRVRLGLLALYLRRRSDWQRYEGVTAKEWILRYGGRRIYDVVWGPLLRGKFGARHDEVSMVWFWGKIYIRFASRQGGSQREQLGYLRGSFGRVVEALAEQVERAGGRIHLESPVTRVLVSEGRTTGLEVTPPGGPARRFACDAIIATVPSFIFLDLVPELPASYAGKLRAVSYQGASCLVLVLNRTVSPIYWLNISDADIPFVVAIEHTNFVPSSRYGGRHILYLSNYLSPQEPLWSLDADATFETYLPHIRKINPDFDASWVQERHLFQDASGQPVVTAKYNARIPDKKTPIDGLYLANTTQIYPQDRGLNYSVRLGRSVAQLVAEAFPAPGA